MHCSQPDSSVQAGILEWVAISFSRGSSLLRDQTSISCISCTAGRFFTPEPAGKPPLSNNYLPVPLAPSEEYYSSLHFFSSQAVYHPSQGRAFLRFKSESHLLQNSRWLWGDQASQVASVVKNSPANAGDRRDVDLIPGLG